MKQCSEMVFLIAVLASKIHVLSYFFGRSLFPPQRSTIGLAMKIDE